MFTALLGALLIPLRPGLWREIWAFERGLPALLARPLPDALAAITPPPDGASAGSSIPLRLLCDTAALLDRRSPLGLCLRRSLTRYRFLRRAGLPLVLNFGARFQNGLPDRAVTGHAWLTLHGQPYAERGEDYRGFTVLLRHPQP